MAAGGGATLHLGGSYVRMAGGADVRIEFLDPNHLDLSQIAGRVYHRVVVPSGGDYRVETGAVTWIADGTAFDLDRYSTSGGGEDVLGLALYDGLDLRGPQLDAALAQGTSATVVLTPDGAPAGSPVVEPIAAQTLADEWLIGNAGLDAQLGLPLGELASLVSPEPLASPTAAPTSAATVLSTEGPAIGPIAAFTPVPTPKPTPKPTPVPTPKPTPRPTPKPTPAGPPNLGSLQITQNGDGSYSFAWPKYTGSGFQYYKLVHEAWGKTPNFPQSPYWACNSSASDDTWSGSIDQGDYAVRVQVVDESSGSVVIRAQTPVVRLTVAAAPQPSAPVSLAPTVDLGALNAVDNPDGSVTFSWTAYTGGSFSYYKLVYETTASGKTPSYPGGSPYWAVPGTGDTSTTVTGIAPGDYQVRIQAIGYPNGSAYAYAQTSVIHVHIAAPSSSDSPSATPT